MLQLSWHSVTITTNQQANYMVKLFREIAPKIGGMDTETDGLHIVLSKPFLFQFGWINPNLKEGYTFVVDIERQPDLATQVINVWHSLAKTLDIYLGANVKYDLHMLKNINLPYEIENISDIQFYIRYGHDALATRNGGPPLALKDYAARYIDPKAKDHEHLLKQEQSAIAKEYNLMLKMRLRNCGTPPEKYKAKSYTLSVIQDMFKDPVFDYTDLPEHIQKVYLDWLYQDVPIYLQKKITGLVDSTMIPYNILNRDNVIKYGHYDIIYLLEIYLQLAPIVKARNNEAGLQVENSLVIPLWEMERVGFKTNKVYLNEAKIKLKNYILSRRNTLYELAGREVKVGQHELIKQILNEDFNVFVASTNSEELELTLSDLIRNTPDNPAIKFIEIIQELRTLEKWYSTYIIRFLKELQNTDRLYTQIFQVGTVSGRVTSDFQQFPKKPIISADGEELFHPRQMIEVTGKDYDAIIYLDYSQIELRFQAIYTILVGNPDLNLCRAYMPYACIDETGHIFDYRDYNDIKAWHDRDWFLQESPDIKWKPVDVHGATTQMATGLSPDHPDFKTLRTDIGKRTNFAKNYGATRKRIRQMFPKKSEAEITKIDEAYYKAFPGVKTYHQYCYERAEYASTSNLFGIKYYGVSGHKLINLLIQGSAAYYLKWKIRQLYDFCKKNNIKSRFQMNIHDELSWEKHISEFDIFFDFQKIMEDWPDTLVPIVAEMSATKTTWAAKKDVKTKDDLRLYLSH